MVSNACLAGMLLILLGCSAAPTIRDVEAVAADTHIVFGSVDVYGARGKRQEWGTGWTGHNFFYLTILPAGSTEAISYKLDKDGMFYWALEPGEYTLLGYHWEKKGSVRQGYIGAGFSVSDSAGDAYIGSIVLRSVRIGLIPSVEDRFDQIVSSYDARFPERHGTSVRHLLDVQTTLGNVVAYRYQCDEAWGIECSDRFSGITPISPECKKTGFPLTPDVKPTFRWQASSREEVSYDLVLYEAAAYSIGGALVNSYMRGRQIAYVEDLREPNWTPESPLEPNTRYFWSVRLREGDTVSGWSTQSHFTFAIVAWSSGYGQWFQFKTSS